MWGGGKRSKLQKIKIPYTEDESYFDDLYEDMISGYKNNGDEREKNNNNSDDKFGGNRYMDKISKDNNSDNTYLSEYKKNTYKLNVPDLVSISHLIQETTRREYLDKFIGKAVFYSDGTFMGTLYEISFPFIYFLPWSSKTESDHSDFDLKRGSVYTLFFKRINNFETFFAINYAVGNKNNDTLANATSQLDTDSFTDVKEFMGQPTTNIEPQIEPQDLLNSKDVVKESKKADWSRVKKPEIFTYTGEDSDRYFLRKAVFDSEKQFLGSIISHSGDILTYLPPGMEDIPKNYLRKRTLGKLFMALIPGWEETINNEIKEQNLTYRRLEKITNNVYDADEYLKTFKDIGKVVPFPNPRKESNPNRGVSSYVENPINSLASGDGSNSNRGVSSYVENPMHFSRKGGKRRTIKRRKTHRRRHQ